jgi:hypothetical protein
MTPSRETALVDRRIREVARSYRKRGYSVTTDPRDFPEVLQGLRPDIVAQKADDRVAIEVKTQPALRGSNELVALAERIATADGWRLELVVTNPPEEAQVERVVAELLRNAEAASAAGLNDVALVYVFSGVEELVRELARRNRIAEGPKSFSDLLRAIAFQGVIDHELFADLQRLSEERSKVVHHRDGGENLSLDELARLLNKLRAELSEDQVAA